MNIDVAKQRAVWGTYGKSGKEALKYVRLIDCSSEHLIAILKTQPHITQCHYNGCSYQDIIVSILKDRVNLEKPSTVTHTMILELEPIPSFGSKKTDVGFAFFPKIIQYDKRRIWIWLESYRIDYQYDMTELKWKVTDFTIL